MTIIKIEMNEQEVQEALADYICRQDGPWAFASADSVELEVGVDYHDRQPGMTGTASFKRAIITIKSE